MDPENNAFSILEFCKEANSGTEIVFDQGVGLRTKEQFETDYDYLKKKEGVEHIHSGYGILGFHRYVCGPYLLLIDKKKLVGYIHQIPIFMIQSTVSIPLFGRSTFRMFANKKEEKKAGEFFSVQKLLNREDFFFSYDYDLTCTLQANLMKEKFMEHQFLFPSSPSLQIFDALSVSSRFLWNEKCLQPFIKKGPQYIKWFVPVIHGFAEQMKCNFDGKYVDILLIARRSQKFAGTRYNRRGFNSNGDVANEVEVEQIVCVNGKMQETSSFVQLRGSFPAYWNQSSASKMTMRLPIQFHLHDTFDGAAKLHFGNLMSRYACPIICLNVARSGDDRTSTECELSGVYERTVARLNTYLPPSSSIIFKKFDMKAARKNKDNILGIILQHSEAALKKTSFFYGRRVQKKQFMPLQMQTGVLRTNCVDCLDRTNSVQFLMGAFALGKQLFRVGALGDGRLNFDESMTRNFCKMYERMGDGIAKQYGGSQAHKKYPTGKFDGRDRRGGNPGREILTSFTRRYANVFSDHERQQVIDAFLGLFATTGIALRTDLDNTIKFETQERNEIFDESWKVFMFRQKMIFAFYFYLLRKFRVPHQFLPGDVSLYRWFLDTVSPFAGDGPRNMSDSFWKFDDLNLSIKFLNSGTKIIFDANFKPNPFYTVSSQHQKIKKIDDFSPPLFALPTLNYRVSQITVSDAKVSSLYQDLNHTHSLGADLLRTASESHFEFDNRNESLSLCTQCAQPPKVCVPEKSAAALVRRLLQEGSLKKFMQDMHQKIVPNRDETALTSSQSQKNDVSLITKQFFEDFPEDVVKFFEALFSSNKRLALANRGVDYFPALLLVRRVGEIVFDVSSQIFLMHNISLYQSIYRQFAVSKFLDENKIGEVDGKAIERRLYLTDLQKKITTDGTFFPVSGKMHANARRRHFSSTVSYICSQVLKNCSLSDCSHQIQNLTNAKKKTKNDDSQIYSLLPLRSESPSNFIIDVSKEKNSSLPRSFANNSFKKSTFHNPRSYRLGEQGGEETAKVRILQYLSTPVWSSENLLGEDREEREERLREFAHEEKCSLGLVETSRLRASQETENRSQNVRNYFKNAEAFAERPYNSFKGRMPKARRETPRKKKLMHLPRSFDIFDDKKSIANSRASLSPPWNVSPTPLLSRRHSELSHFDLETDAETHQNYAWESSRSLFPEIAPSPLSLSSESSSSLSYSPSLASYTCASSIKRIFLSSSECSSVSDFSKRRVRRRASNTQKINDSSQRSSSSDSVSSVSSLSLAQRSPSLT